MNEAQVPDAARGKARRLLALLLGLLAGAAAGAAVWFLWPAPASRAQAPFSVIHPAPVVLFPAKEKENAADFERFNQQQAALIKSRFVLNKALENTQRFETVRSKTDPVIWLENAIEVDFPNLNMMHVSIQGAQGEELAGIVNAVAKSYLEETVNKERIKSLDRLEQLKQLSNKLEEKVQYKKKTLEELQRAAGAGTTPHVRLKAMIAEKLLNAAIRELTQVRAERRRIQAAIFGGATTAEPAVVSCLVLTQSAFPANLAAAPLLASSPEPALKRQAQTLERLEALLQNEIANLVQDMARPVMETNLDLEAFRNDIQRAQVHFEKISKEIDKLELERQAPPRVFQMEAATVRGLGRDNLQYLMTALAGLSGLIIVLAAFGSRAPQQGG